MAFLSPLPSPSQSTFSKKAASGSSLGSILGSTLALTASLLIAATPAAAGTPASHAPIGVMGDHMHGKGEFMMSYRFMQMKMDENYVGSSSIPTSAVLRPNGGEFMVAPAEMTTDMHMLGMMYAPTDRVTLMLMGNFVEKSMDHITAMGGRFTTEASSIGDTKVSALIGLRSDLNIKTHFNVGLSLPTGDIDNRDNNPRCAMMGNCPSRLPYPMQTGSGTYDFMLGMTGNVYSGAWNVGGQFNATIRTGKNSQDYRLGNRVEGTTWLQRDLADWISLGARASYSEWKNIRGEDPQLAGLCVRDGANPPVIPTACTELRGGKRIQGGLAVNLMFGQHRLAAEYAVPLYQNLIGPQLGSDSMLTLGYQIAFGGHKH